MFNNLSKIKKYFKIVSHQNREDITIKNMFNKADQIAELGSKIKTRNIFSDKWEIKLFLKIYGKALDKNTDKIMIKFTLIELGRLCRFLPRGLETATVLDKLDDANLLIYEEDNFYFNFKKAKSIYQNLKERYGELN